MKKDFDGWNQDKKQIQEREDILFYKQREVRWCRLGVNVGFEQDGTGTAYARPVLILKGFSKHACLVVPLTTSTKENPYHVSAGKIERKEAFAIISQIKCIDTRRLDQRLGWVEKPNFKKIQKAIKDML
ncbi:type II toxin-antitoxin system PemK/MazF family toxin [Candidatus Kaiserbacteria bacterium]|nr:type II toxin-antitoxin system PemK/MazF family toxin [Candidatus Kaiserbacteria bacterium]